jgi:hypothetical protein
MLATFQLSLVVKIWQVPPPWFKLSLTKAICVGASAGFKVAGTELSVPLFHDCAPSE